MMPLKILPKTLMVISLVLGFFLLYSLTMSQAKKTNQKSPVSPHLLQKVDSNLSITRVFPSVLFDSGSNKENLTAKTSADKEHIHPEAILDSESNMDEREVDKVADTPITLQDAFVFCPMAGTFVLNETLKQGIFASENEMSQTEATKNSIVNRFITINFEEKDANRSKMQTITEYLKDVK